MLVCNQSPLYQNFVKIQPRDPEILDPEKRDFRENDLHFWGHCALKNQKIKNRPRSGQGSRHLQVTFF